MVIPIYSISSFFLSILLYSCCHTFNFYTFDPYLIGLFSRAALMSGSALAPGAIARDAENYARLLAKELNCPVYVSTVNSLNI